MVDRELDVFVPYSEGDEWLVHRRGNSDEHMVRQRCGMPRPRPPVQVSLRGDDHQRPPLEKPGHGQIRRQHER